MAGSENRFDGDTIVGADRAAVRVIGVAHREVRRRGAVFVAADRVDPSDDGARMAGLGIGRGQRPVEPFEVSSGIEAELVPRDPQAAVSGLEPFLRLRVVFELACSHNPLARVYVGGLNRLGTC